MRLPLQLQRFYLLLLLPVGLSYRLDVYRHAHTHAAAVGGGGLRVLQRSTCFELLLLLLWWSASVSDSSALKQKHYFCFFTTTLLDASQVLVCRAVASSVPFKLDDRSKRTRAHGCIAIPKGTSPLSCPFSAKTYIRGGEILPATGVEGGSGSRRHVYFRMYGRLHSHRYIRCGGHKGSQQL